MPDLSETNIPSPGSEEREKRKSTQYSCFESKSKHGPHVQAGNITEKSIKGKKTYHVL